MVEPEKGVYDFSYIDHAKSMAEKHHLKVVLNWFGHYASGDGTIYGNLTGELYAPMYIVSDEETYPRAVDGDGVIHHNAASYDYEPIIGREIAAFRAFIITLAERSRIGWSAARPVKMCKHISRTVPTFLSSASTPISVPSGGPTTVAGESLRRRSPNSGNRSCAIA